MYSIIANGKEIGVVEAPTYIRLQKNGYFALCDENIAQGIAFDGNPYQLADRPDMEKGLTEVRLAKIDSGAKIMEQQSANLRNAANIDYLSMMTDIDLPGEELGVGGDM